MQPGVLADDDAERQQGGGTAYGAERRAAWIRRGDQVFATDLGTINGIYVDDRPIAGMTLLRLGGIILCLVADAVATTMVATLAPV